MIGIEINRVVYKGDGKATNFPYEFTISSKEELIVTIVDPDRNKTELSSDYFIDEDKKEVIYPGYATGEEPAEAERPPTLPSGWFIVLQRQTRIDQQSDLGGKWPFDVTEDSLDKITRILQDLNTKSERSLTISVEAENVNTMLPSPEPNKGFYWDETGKKLVSSDNPNLAAKNAQESETAAKNYMDRAETAATSALKSESNANEAVSMAKAWAMSDNSPDNIFGNKSAKKWAEEAKNYRDIAIAGQLQADWNEEDTEAKSYVKNKPSIVKTYDSVDSAQKDMKLKVGELIHTLGFYAPEDEGGATYCISENISDTLPYITLENDLFAILVLNTKCINVKQFGAKGDGKTDDTAILQQAFKVANSLQYSVYVPKGNYIISDTLLYSPHYRCITFNAADAIFTYQGTGFAFRIQNLLEDDFIFGKIYAENGSGIELYAADKGHITNAWSTIKGKGIKAKDYCIKYTYDADLENYTSSIGFSNEIRIKEISFVGSTAVGIYASSARGASLDFTRLEDCSFEQLDMPIWLAGNCTSWSIINPRSSPNELTKFIKTTGKNLRLMLYTSSYIMTTAPFLDFSTETTGCIICASNASMADSSFFKIYEGKAVSNSILMPLQSSKWKDFSDFLTHGCIVGRTFWLVEYVQSSFIPDTPLKGVRSLLIVDKIPSYNMWRLEQIDLSGQPSFPVYGTYTEGTLTWKAPLEFKGTISTITDLNDIKDTSKYTFYSSTQDLEIKNSPIPYYKSQKVMVITWASPVMCVQYYYATSSSIYVRFFYNNAWNAWKQIT